MAGLTRRQSELLAFLKAYQAANGFSPSYAEIAAHLGLNTRSSVNRMVDALQARGAIRRRKGLKRSLEIIENEGAERLLRRLVDAIQSDDWRAMTRATNEATRFLGRSA
ncbi:MarR family transcriptional regulator [Mesorhizobium sp. 1M-11]|uniref:LexA family protein n=1 Tax=Mesorhizobium sp. 1M-11 TaxID=1529006 RepID=UPI0006C74F81|nr:MarR family transcriptional regulator [Mesorhizobium sp. 1M-11]